MIITGKVLIPPKERLKTEGWLKKEALEILYNKTMWALPAMKYWLAGQVQKRMHDSHEIQAIKYDLLQYDLGLKEDEAEEVIDQIPHIIVNSMDIEVKKIIGRLSIKLKLIHSGYDDILAIKGASFLQTYTRNTPTVIPWLEWLLTRGYEIVVSDYHVIYKQSDASRSGGAFMVQTGSFRIPPQFAGTPDDNFLTRALKDMSSDFVKAVERFVFK